MDDYDSSYAHGRADYRAGLRYDPGLDATAWAYYDGWSAAADEATASHGHALACYLAWNGGVGDYECRQAASATAATGERDRDDTVVTT